MLSQILLMAGDMINRRTQFVMGKFARGKGAMGRPKALLLLYCAYEPLIQLNQSDLMRDWPNFVGFSGVIVDKT